MDFQAGRRDPLPLEALADPPRPPAGATVGQPDTGGGQRAQSWRGSGPGAGPAVTRRGGGEGSPAPLTRGGGTGPSLRLSRSKTERGAEGGGKERPDSLFYPETEGPAGNDEGRGRPGPCGNRFPRVRPNSRGRAPRGAARSPAASGVSSVSGPASLRLPGPDLASPGPALRPAAPPLTRWGGEWRGQEGRGRVVEVQAAPVPPVGAWRLLLPASPLLGTSQGLRK